MPVAITEGGVGLIGDKIYVVEGWRPDNAWVTADDILEYDPVMDSWKIMISGPVATGSFASCLLDGKMYILGGMEGISSMEDANKMWTYDPLREEWDITSLPDMIYPHLMHGTAEVINGKIYVIGGVGLPPEFNIAQSEVFDGEKWEPIAEMPVPVTMHSSIVHNQKILVFGGDSAWTMRKGYSTNFIQEYDPVPDTWRLLDPMPFQRSGMACEKLGNFVYLIGGATDDRDGSTYVSEMWRYELESLVDPGVGISNSRADQFSVFPNPVLDLLNVQTGLSADHVIEIISLNGQVVYSMTMDQSVYQIELSSFQKGVYLITIRSKEFVTTKKIIKL